MMNQTRGTFTPTFSLTTPGDLTVSYAAQRGVYAQAGSILILGFQLICTPTYTTGAGNVVIGGFPEGVTDGLFGGFLTNLSGLRLVTTNYSMVFLGAPVANFGQFQLLQGGSATGSQASVNTTNAPSGVQIGMNGTCIGTAVV